MSMHPHPALRIRFEFLFPCALVFIVCLLYASTLSGGFLGDDFGLLTLFYQNSEHPHTHAAQWEVVVMAFCGKLPEGHFPKMYRPLWYLSLYLEHLLWGTQSFGFRLDSLLLFSCSAVLLWRLVLRLSTRKGIAVAAALLFVTWPTSYSSILWIADRAGQLSVLFQLMTLLLFEGSLARRSHDRIAVRRMGGWLAFLAALLAKETSFVLFPILFLRCLPFFRGTTVRDRRRPWLELLPYALLLILYFCWRHQHLGTLLGTPRAGSSILPLRMLWYQFAVGLSVLVPIRLETMSLGILCVSCLTTASFLTLGLLFQRRCAPCHIFVLVWFIVSLLPYAMTPAIPGSQKNVRFTYPCSVPFVVLLALALEGYAIRLATTWWSRPAREIVRRRIFALACSITLLVSLVLLLHNRAGFVEAGRRSCKIVDRILSLACVETDIPLLIYDLPAYEANAPLMLNAFPYLLRRPFLQELKRPLLVYTNGNLGHFGMLKDFDNIRSLPAWQFLRWDAPSGFIVPAPALQRFHARGRLHFERQGRLLFGKARERIRFSLAILHPFLDREVEMSGIRLKTADGWELLVSEIRPR